MVVVHRTKVQYTRAAILTHTRLSSGSPPYGGAELKTHSCGAGGFTGVAADGACASCARRRAAGRALDSPRTLEYRRVRAAILKVAVGKLNLRCEVFEEGAPAASGVPWLVLMPNAGGTEPEKFHQATAVDRTI